MRQFSNGFKILNHGDRLAQRIFLFLTILFVGFITFTSLSTTSTKHKVKADVFAQLFTASSLDYVYAYHDLGDLSTNVLFYIPLGLFLSLTVSFGKPRFFSFWLVGGFALSALMEASQYFIGRYADPVDLATNAIGFIFGFELGVAAIRFLGLRPSAVLGINPDNQTSTKINTIASVRFLYVAVYLISSWLPFDVTFNLEQILNKCHPDRYGQCRIILDPFYHILHWKHDAEVVFGLFWGLLPLGVLTAVLNAFRKKLNVVQPIVVCLIVVLISETGQIFMVTRTTDVAMFFLAAIAGVMGWVIARVWFMLQDLEGYSTFENEKHRNKFLRLMILLYIFLLCIAALSPYRFELSLKAVEQKMLYQTNWIPFHNQIMLRKLEMCFWLLKDVGAFIPFGLLMTFYLRVVKPSLSRLWSIIIVASAGLLLAFLLEAVKIIGVGQYGDFTSVLLAFLGTVMGSVCFRFLSKTVVAFD